MADETTPKAAAPESASAPVGGGGLKGFRTYLGETAAEARRVTWPNKTDWVNSSVITLLTILALSLLMAGYNAVAGFVAGFFFG